MRVNGSSGIADLQTQLESLFDQVWRSEADWRLWDRIDAVVEHEALREKRTSLRDPKIEPDVGE